MNKYLLFVAASFLLAFGCQSGASKQDQKGDNASTGTTDLPVSVLKSYFLLNTVEIKERQCWLLPNAKAFTDHFGLGKTIENEIGIPHFDTDFIAAIAVPPTTRMTDIRVSKIVREGDAANVHFEIVEGKDQLTWTAQPVLLFSFPRKEQVKTINFIQNNVQISSFPAPAPDGEQLNKTNGGSVLTNYFFTENVLTDNAPYCTIIGNQPEFSKRLMAHKTTSFISPDFNKEVIIGMALQQTQQATELHFESASEENGEINVRFQLRKGGSQTYAIKPTAIVDVRRGNAQSVSFFLDGKKIKTLPIPPVVPTEAPAGSPAQ